MDQSSYTCESYYQFISGLGIKISSLVKQNLANKQVHDYHDHDEPGKTGQSYGTTAYDLQDVPGHQRRVYRASKKHENEPGTISDLICLPFGAPLLCFCFASLVIDQKQHRRRRTSEKTLVPAPQTGHSSQTGTSLGPGTATVGTKLAVLQEKLGKKELEHWTA